MTNLQHILTDEEYSGLREMSVTDFVKENVGVSKESGKMMLCSALGCTNCRFFGEGCTRKVAEWLDEEYQEPLPFPIGTPIEVEDYWNNVMICYYNGIDDGVHTGVYCKKSIGTNKGFTIIIDTARKVGE